MLRCRVCVCCCAVVFWFDVVLCVRVCVCFNVFVWCVCGRVCGGVWLVVVDCLCACGHKNKQVRLCVLCGV